MKYRVAITKHEKATVDAKSLERENSTRASIFRGKNNHCVIFPANVSMVAESVERRDKSWFVKTKVASDLVIQIRESSFHLHKLAMVSKSGYLNRLVFQRRSNGETNHHIRIDNLPGGFSTFELVVKFCYGWKINLTATNIAPLYCAAHFLEMSDDLELENLIPRTEDFLSFVIFSSWKDTFQIFKSCESISSWARELQILKRCSEAIAWKACTDPKAISPDSNDDDWWFEDISYLRIDHFIEVIVSTKKRGMRPELVGKCIAHWTANWLLQVKFGHENLTHKGLTFKMQRVTTECLIRALPIEKKSVSCNFLLHLLKIGLVLEIDSELLKQLERRTAFMLDSCRAKDLLVKNYGKSDEVYDISIVAKVVVAYVSFISNNPESRILAIGRLVDEYLTLVARSTNLPAKDFWLLVEALPRNARYCDDNLYRAIDMYLKAHPSLTEEEKSSICRAMSYHKLSQEARKHAMKNDRLPLNVSTRFILLEQVNMTKSMTANGSNYKRTKSQAIMRVSKGLGKASMNSLKEVKMMMKDVETMKVQLNELQFCRMELQRQVKRGIFYTS